MQLNNKTLLSCHNDGKGTAPSRFLGAGDVFSVCLCSGRLSLAAAWGPVRQKCLLHAGSLVPGVIAEFGEQE